MRVRPPPRARVLSSRGASSGFVGLGRLRLTTPARTFTLVIDGDAGTDERIDALFEAGCDDATFSHGSTISYGDLDGDGDDLFEAVLPAIDAVESVEGLSVRRVDEDDLVTVDDIAERLGRSRQSVNPTGA